MRRGTARDSWQAGRDMVPATLQACSRKDNADAIATVVFLFPNTTLTPRSLSRLDLCPTSMAVSSPAQQLAIAL